MKPNYVRAKLKRGEPSVGTWLTLPDPTAALLMSRVGFDWLTVEMEHTPVTFETAAQSYAIIAASGVVPLARVPWNHGQCSHLLVVPTLLRRSGDVGSLPPPRTSKSKPRTPMSSAAPVRER